MKKSTLIVICAVLTLILAGCGRDLSARVGGKTFVYEKEGFYGDFKITVRDDGTFVYYEGMASSYVGMGEWTVRQNTISLQEGSRTNIFEIEEGKLIWRADGSDNFIYVALQDGEAFCEE